MYSKSEVVSFIDEFKNEVVAIGTGSIADLADIGSAVAAGSYDLAKLGVESIIKSAVSLLEESGVEVPKFGKYVAIAEESVTISIKNKDGEAFKKVFSISGNTQHDIATFVAEAFADMLATDLANKNINELNAVLEDACEKAKTPYKVSVSGVGARKLAEISDVQVIFEADPEKVFDMEELIIFAEENEIITPELKAEAFQSIVDDFAAAQTTPQLVAAHNQVIDFITGITKTNRAGSLIRKTVTKSVSEVAEGKSAIAYDKNDDILSLVSVTPEGNTVVLKPFNIKTMENVTA